MLFRQSQYPEFVTDHQQILTSDHLNKLFGYVDEQGRLTRANLIGIGILCGLEVSVNDAGTEISISKGCGITSLGYLVSTEARTYTEFKIYDATQDRKYGLFVNGSNRPRFHIDELKVEATATGTTRLSPAYLQDRVVVMYVELLSESNKNCDPSSCDDKGVTVTVNLRPLLIHRDDVAKYLVGRTDTVAPTSAAAASALPLLNMRRFNVPATPIADSPTLLGAYQAVLNEPFIRSVESTLTQSFNVMAPLIADMYPSNPFVGINNNYKFLYDGTISSSNLINIQYYYDLFSDVYAAYTELRAAAIRVMNVCMPDENLFPQHLLLGPAGSFTKVVDYTKNTFVAQNDFVAVARTAAVDQNARAVANIVNADVFAKNPTGALKDDGTVSYRNDFMPSSALRSCCGQVSELRWLFKRLVLMLSRFSVPRQAFTIRQTYDVRGVVDTRVAYNNANLAFADTSKSAVATGAVLAQAQTAVVAAPTTGKINISTGVSATNTVLAAGAKEANWVCPSDMNTVITPHPAWGTLSGSTWIGNFAAAGPANFTFTRTFSLASSGTISFQALADNNLTITLDGVQVAKTPGGTSYGFKTGNETSYTGIVAAGTHTLTAVAHNNEGPAGFILSGTVTYTIPPVKPVPIPLPTPIPVPVPVGPIVPIRITPSFLGNVDLSDKSIPFYYDAVNGTDRLFQYWDYTKTVKGKENRNLSYNALTYNDGTPNDYVLQALRYDLEKYDFLRVEGHLGIQYQQAVKNITAIRDQYRLPFEVVAIRSTMAPAVANEKHGCCSEGIELTYNIVKNEWVDVVNRISSYIDNNPGVGDLMGQQQLAAFTQQLQKCLALVKDDVPAFAAVYTSFTAAYATLDTMTRGFRANVMAGLYLKNGQTGTSSLGEDLVDHLDEIILSYKKGAFEEIYNAYQLSKTAVERPLSLQEYLADNPGIQHKAGVPPGGTLVLVYHTKTAPVVVQQPTTQTNTNTAVTNQAQSQLRASLAVQTNDVAAAQQNVAAAPQQQAFTAIPKAVTAVNYDLTKAIDDLVVLKNTGASPAVLEQQVRDILWVKDTVPVVVKQEVKDIFADVLEGTVIADFYLPYICCTDCPTVRFVPSEDVPEQATVKLEGGKKEFCIDDEGSYKILFSPEGGTLTMDGVEMTDDGNGNFYFVPSDVTIPAGTTSVKPVITYTTEDSVAFMELTVYAKPIPAFDVSVNGNTITLINNTVGNPAVTWAFGDNVTSSVFSPQPYTYRTAGTYNISLTATNSGNCADTLTKQVTIQDVSITLGTQLRDFCQGDANGTTTFPLTVTPADAVVSGEGVIAPQNAGDSYHFRAANVVMSPGTTKYISLIATKGTLSKSIDVQIHAVPDATFTYTQDGNRINFAYTPVSGTTLSWDFGDGSTSTTPNIRHDYNSAGDFIVVLTVKNGSACSKTYTKTIKVEGLGINLPDTTLREFCQGNDAGRTSYRIVTTPADAIVSGPGVTESNGVYSFNPANVSIPAGTTQTIMLTAVKGTMSVQLPIIIHAVPNAAFTYTQNGNAFSFTYNAVAGTTVHWTFGDNGTSDEVSPKYNYPKAGTYTVTLTVMNNGCPGVYTAQVRIDDVTIALDSGETVICLEQNSEIRTIKVSPTGGVVSGEGVSGGNPYVFDPRAVTFAKDTIQKDVLLTYTRGTQSATVIIRVTKKADATFTYAPNGQVVTFNYTQPPGTTLLWNFGDSQTATTARVDHVYEQAGRYTVTLRVNSPCGSVEYTAQVTVGNATIALASGKDVACMGDESSGMYAVVTSPSGGVVTGEGIVSGNPYVFDAGKVNFADGALKKTVQITYTTGSLSASMFVTAYKAVNSNFTFSKNNNIVSFFYTPLQDVTLTWHFGDGTTSTAANPVHDYKAPGNYNVTLVVDTDSALCVGNSSGQTITIGNATIALKNGLTRFCQGDANGQALTDILVSPAGGIVTGPGVTAPSQAGDPYRFRAAAISMAAGTTQVVTLNYVRDGFAASINITVDSVPVSAFTYTKDQLSVSFKYTATAGTVINWIFGDGTSSSETQPTHVYAQDGTYTVRMTANYGSCTTSSQQNIQVAKTQQQAPQINVSDTQTEFCSNDDMVITLQATPAGGVFTMDGNTINQVYNFNPSTIALLPDRQPRTVRFNYTLNGNSAVRNMLITAAPSVNFTWVPAGVNTIRFTNESTGGTALDWDFGDGAGSAQANSPVYTYDTPGTYPVTLTVLNGICSNSVTLNVDVAAAESGDCTLPCDGLSETSTYTWPSDTVYLKEQIFDQGKTYSFIVTKYIVNGKIIVDKGIQFDITPELFQQQGYGAIISTIGKAFPEGLEMEYQAGDVWFNSTALNFTIKHYACQPFIFEMIDDYRTEQEFTYTYTEEGLFVDGKPFQYEQRINALFADECIDQHTAPCEGKMISCEYPWPHADSQFREWVAMDNYVSYDMIIHQYSVDKKILISKDHHYIVSWDMFERGLPDATDLLNNYFLLREGLQFSPVDSANGNTVSITHYECLDFVFDFTAYVTIDGEPDVHSEVRYQYTQNGVYVYDAEQGQFRFLSEAANCNEATGVGPAAVDGLKAWWKADSGVTAKSNNVVAWTDMSGNENTLKQLDAIRTPLFIKDTNNRPVVVFKQGALAGPTNGIPDDGDFTVFYVGTSALGRGAAIRGSWNYIMKPDAAQVAVSSDSLNIKMQQSLTAPVIIATTFEQSGGSSIFTAFDRKGTVIDRIESGSTILKTSAIGFIMGLAPSKATYAYADGMLYEALVYDSVLKQEEIVKILDYLVRKYRASAVTKNAIAWWSADAGVTTDSKGLLQWADQSGNGNTLTAVDAERAPAIVGDWSNKMSALEFSGMHALRTDLLKIPDGTVDITILMVMEKTDIEKLACVFELTDDMNGANGFGYFTNAGENDEIGIQVNGWNRHGMPRDKSFNTKGIYTLNCHMSDPDPETTVEFNGTVYANDSIWGGSTDHDGETFNSDSFNLGARAGNNAFGYFRLAELIILGTNATTKDIELLKKQLAAKYGI